MNQEFFARAGFEYNVEKSIFYSCTMGTRPKIVTQVVILVTIDAHGANHYSLFSPLRLLIVGREFTKDGVPQDAYKY